MGCLKYFYIVALVSALHLALVAAKRGVRLGDYLITRDGVYALSRGEPAAFMPWSSPAAFDALSDDPLALSIAAHLVGLAPASSNCRQLLKTAISAFGALLIRPELKPALFAVAEAVERSMGVPARAWLLDGLSFALSHTPSTAAKLARGLLAAPKLAPEPGVLIAAKLEGVEGDVAVGEWRGIPVEAPSYLATGRLIIGRVAWYEKGVITLMP